MFVANKIFYSIFILFIIITVGLLVGMFKSASEGTTDITAAYFSAITFSISMAITFFTFSIEKRNPPEINEIINLLKDTSKEHDIKQIQTELRNISSNIEEINNKLNNLSNNRENVTRQEWSLIKILFKRGSK